MESVAGGTRSVSESQETLRMLYPPIKDQTQLFLFDSTSSVGDGHLHALLLKVNLDRDASLNGVLERVRQQVEDALLIQIRAGQYFMSVKSRTGSDGPQQLLSDLRHVYCWTSQRIWWSVNNEFHTSSFDRRAEL